MHVCVSTRNAIASQQYITDLFRLERVREVEAFAVVVAGAVGHAWRHPLRALRLRVQQKNFLHVPDVRKCVPVVMMAYTRIQLHIRPLLKTRAT